MELTINEGLSGEFVVSINHTHVKTHFSYEVVRGIGVIEDKTNELGGMSVTNNAEAVISGIKQHFNGTLPSTIIYRDTSHHWDKLNHDGDVFTGFETLKVGTITKGFTKEEAIMLAV